MEDNFDKYLGALNEEMKQYKGIDVDTVFVGGGTPTVLNEKQLNRLIGDIKNNFTLSETCEFTFEANPGTLNVDKIKALKDGGVNRVSVGVQSFVDRELSALGRIHNSNEAFNTVSMIHDMGITNINIDLMTSIPYQTGESLIKSLNMAFTLPITHISAYSLILEEGTPLFNEYENGVFSLPDDDTDREMFDTLKSKMKEHGFLRYEISNFSKPGYESRHNLKYWNCDEYIGIGLSAHSYFDKCRFSNTDNLGKYLNLEFRNGDIKTLTYDDMVSEFMMLGFRKTRGISEAEFKKRFGKDINDIYGRELHKFIELSLIEYDSGYYRLTDRGLDISNSVICEFIL